jgi:ATP-dependent DNA helicase RecQ
MKDCGICDNCLKKKSTQLTTEEFSIIEKQILSALQARPVDSKTLVEHISGYKKEKAWEVISFLESEKKITVNRNGMISLNN